MWENSRRAVDVGQGQQMGMWRWSGWAADREGGDLLGTCRGGCLNSQTFDPLPAGEFPQIGEGEVTLWKFLANPGDDLLLTASELQRLDGFRSMRARECFLASRAGVRKVAAGYIGCPTGAIRIGAESGGKPVLEGVEGLHFNISHTAGEVWAVFSRAAVGLDVESEGRTRSHLAIAKRFFHPDESARVEAAGADGERVFTQIWTAREAVVKLSGDGIARGFSGVWTGGDGTACIGGKPVFLRTFSSERRHFAIASFQSFVVKDWFCL